MEKLLVHGGIKLSGNIHISGAKNAALPLICATILTKEDVVISNIPNLADIENINLLLKDIGVDIEDLWSPSISYGKTIKYNAGNIKKQVASYHLVNKMRASVLVLGPLLARFGVARVAMPGGCAIGTRPIDLHLQALKTMGARVEIHEGYVEAYAPDGLKGAKVLFPITTVGGTENILLAATLAKGTTIIENAACEPEITDLVNLLVNMGAKISGVGTSTLIVEGVKELFGADFEVLPDRIEAGSYAIAAAITGGKVKLVNARSADMLSFLTALEQTGVAYIEEDDGIIIDAEGVDIKPFSITTQPHPGFPTDLQAQWCALMLKAKGVCAITETIFENRFMHVPEMVRMGAKMNIKGHNVLIEGGTALEGTDAVATDLRAAFSLVLAGLIAEGVTEIHELQHIDRGYEKVEFKLREVGAKVERVEDYQLS